jgi:hypothetical protein
MYSWKFSKCTEVKTDTAAIFTTETYFVQKTLKAPTSPVNPGFLVININNLTPKLITIGSVDVIFTRLS